MEKYLISLYKFALDSIPFKEVIINADNKKEANKQAKKLVKINGGCYLIKKVEENESSSNFK